MKQAIALSALFLSAFVEGSILTIPITLSLLIVLFILESNNPVIFVLALLVGVLLDVLTLSGFGLHSLFFIIFILVAAMYEKKFEIKTPQFVFAASFVGGILYFATFHQGLYFFEIIAGSIFALFLFLFLLRFQKIKLQREM